MPVSFWNSAPARCPALPMPDVPCVALSELAFSQSMKPLRSSAGMVLRATMISGMTPISEIGSKSFTTSYGRS